MELELIADYGCITGEGPLWHPDEGQLYWIDIPTGRMFRYDPASGQHEQCYAGAVIGGFTLQEDGALLLFMADGAVRRWRAGALETVLDQIEGEQGGRFNDVIADPAGRVFCGTMPIGQQLGRLYRLDPGGQLSCLLDGLGCSNGMGFTADRTQLYHTDSGPRQIVLFDYDESNGALANQRRWLQVPDNDGEGLPDGLTIDAEGYIWSARWDGGCLVRYTPDGHEERRISLPARKVSSLTFGGPDYRDIYITTAGGDDKAANGPGAGALFRLRLGITGRPEFRSRI